MANGFTGMGCGCCAPPGVTCGVCSIPANDLTVHWTNGILGNGSTTLVYQGGTVWKSACSNELTYRLFCFGTLLAFQAIYYISQPCPNGTTGNCQNGGGSGNALTVTSLTCGDSFEMDLTCDGTNCPILNANGFTSFKITNP